MNSCLKDYMEKNSILGEEKAGFREGYSTTDHIFLKSIIDIYLHKNKKLYCVFVDYKAAYDKINIAILWEKLISSGINGYFFRVIFNMYEKAKSCLQHRRLYCLIIFM